MERKTVSNLEERYCRAIARIGHLSLLEQPESVKLKLSQTTDLYEKVKLLEELVDSIPSSKQNLEVNLYLDMDGTIAEYLPQSDMDNLYEKGYFLNLPVIRESLEGIKMFMKKYPYVNVWILSAYLADSKWALQEKIMWVNKNFPEMDEEKQLFVKCGQKKSDVVLNAKNEYNFLLDDHTQNLFEWEKTKNCYGIKLINRINGKGGKWKGNRINYNLSPIEFSEKLSQIISSTVKTELESI